MDDVRRVTSNWREYAGLMLQGRAKERIANEIDNPSAVLHDTGRAVFDLDLLLAVARTQEKRSITTHASGTSAKAHIFALSDLLYCAHCQALATQADNLKLRSRLIGWNQRGTLRYRHSEANRCHCKARTVRTELIEDDFARLIDVLDVHPDSIQLLAEIALETTHSMDANDEKEFETKKKAALAKHRRAIANSLALCKAGEMDFEEYLRDKDYHERQIASWEARTTDRQRIILELTTCMEMVKRLKHFWNITDGDDRKLLAHSLFDEIVYDSDTQRITDFSVKSWAEPFLILRAALYEDEMSEEMKNRFNGGSGSSNGVSSHDPNGLLRRKSLQLRRIRKSIRRSLRLLYPRLSNVPMTTAQRNRLICERYRAGETLSDLARHYGITVQRVHQITNSKAKYPYKDGKTK